MPRGGKRQGVPGVSYPQRSDLNATHMPSPQVKSDGGINTTANAGIEAPPAPVEQAAPPQIMRGPDDSPMLGMPSLMPNEPITAGLNTAALLRPPRQSLGDTLSMLAAYDQSGEIQRLAMNAYRRGW